MTGADAHRSRYVARASRAGNGKLHGGQSIHARISPDILVPFRRAAMERGYQLQDALAEALQRWVRWGPCDEGGGE